MNRFLAPFGVLALGLAALAWNAAHAAESPLWLPGLFSDGMVLQQGKPVPVWGKAAPGDTVSVRFQGREATTTADPDGRWTVFLGPLKMDKTGAEFTVEAGGEKRAIQDVLVGEVWLISGQSNAAYLMAAMSRTPELLGSQTREEAEKAPKGPSIVKAEADMAAANDPLLRSYRVASISADRLRVDAPSKVGWMKWDRRHAPEFSVLGYYFAEKLRAALDVPVGIIMCAWGGSSACSWISPEALRAPPLNAFFPEDAPEWGANLAPSRLWNGMLRPVAPFAISGFCWYQGETEATDLQNAFVYRHLLTALIRCWRGAWHDDKLPFYIIQLPPLTNGQRWEIVRESQAVAADEADAALVPTLDIVPPNDLHPKNKHVVADRLANLVLADTYGRQTWPGLARVERTEFGDGVVRIHFNGDLKTGDDKPVRGFEVAGEDREFKPAEAMIEGTAVVVKSAGVPGPVAVRYAFTQAPEVNLFSAGGLPVPPFRSDDWPLAGQEMMPQELPVKARLATVTPGGALAGKDPAPWRPSETAADQTTLGKMYMKASARDLRVQMKGFPPREKFPASPVIDWTAHPEMDASRGATFEVAVFINDGGAEGFDIDAGIRQPGGGIRRYRLQAFHNRVVTHQNFLGGRVPSNTQMRLLRSDMDPSDRVFRLAIRPDGVAQIYDGAEVIGMTTGEMIPGSDEPSWFRVGKTAEGGRWSASIAHVAFDTGGAFAPDQTVPALRERLSGEEE